MAEQNRVVITEVHQVVASYTAGNLRLNFKNTTGVIEGTGLPVLTLPEAERYAKGLLALIRAVAGEKKHTPDAGVIGC